MRRFCRCRDPDRSRHHAICSRVARRSYGPWAIGTSFGTLRASVARSHSCRDAALATRNIRFTGIFADGETRTRTGDTTIFSRYVLAAAASGEIPGKQAVLAGSGRDADIRNLRSFQPFSGDGARLIPSLRVRSRIQSTISSWAASPAALAFEHAGDRRRACAGQAVGVEEVCREQERGALVGVGERRVVGEVCEQDGRLLGQRWVGLDWPDDASGVCRADSASASCGSLTMASRSTASRKAAMSRSLRDGCQRAARVPD